MKARMITLRGTIVDDEYRAIEVFGKEFSGTDGYPSSILLKTPCSDYEHVERVEELLEEVVRRINDN